MNFTQEDVVTSATHEDVLGAIEGVRDEVAHMIAAAKTEIAMAVAEALDDKIDVRVSLALAEFREEAGIVQGCFDQAMLRLESIIRAMPTPEVTVAPAEVKFEMPQRRVTKYITYDIEGRPATITEEGYTVPNNTNAQAITFANNYARVVADTMVSAYLTMKRTKQVWDGQNIISVIPNDANLIQDGATVATGTADGRAPITDAQVNVLISNLSTLINTFEANTNLILNQTLQVSVNSQSKVT